MNSFKSYEVEFTVFIIVSIPNLKASAILISKKVRRKVIENNEIIKTKIDKKYLFRSDLSTSISDK